jgi:peptidoglycan/LPS O-acetylase OafA/YrhL
MAAVPTGAFLMPVTVPRRGRRPLAWGTCAVIVLLPVVSWLLGGPDAAAGAAIGPALVAAFFAGGWVPVAVGTRVPALLAFILLGLGYALRIVLLLVVLTALRDARWVDGRVLGGTVVFAALVWGFVQIGVHVTSRRPTIEPMG